MGAKCFNYSFVGLGFSLFHQFKLFIYYYLEVDPISVSFARTNILINNLSDLIQIIDSSSQTQLLPDSLFSSLSSEDHPQSKPLSDSSIHYDFVMTNPPFFDTYQINTSSINKNEVQDSPTELSSFSFTHQMLPKQTLSDGTVSEKSFEGGERAFLKKLLEESLTRWRNITWFTSLVGIKADLLWIKHEIENLRTKLCIQLHHSEQPCQGITDINVRTFELSQGRKARWVVCWSFVGGESPNSPSQEVHSTFTSQSHPLPKDFQTSSVLGNKCDCSNNLVSQPQPHKIKLPNVVDIILFYDNIHTLQLRINHLLNECGMVKINSFTSPSLPVKVNSDSDSVTVFHLKWECIVYRGFINVSHSSSFLSNNSQLSSNSEDQSQPLLKSEDTILLSLFPDVEKYAQKTCATDYLCDFYSETLSKEEKALNTIGEFTLELEPIQSNQFLVRIKHHRNKACPNNSIPYCKSALFSKTSYQIRNKIWFYRRALSAGEYDAFLSAFLNWLEISLESTQISSEKNKNT